MYYVSCLSGKRKTFQTQSRIIQQSSNQGGIEMDEKNKTNNGNVAFRDVSVNPYGFISDYADAWSQGYRAACEDFKKFAVWTQDLE